MVFTAHALLVIGKQIMINPKVHLIKTNEDYFLWQGICFEEHLNGVCGNFGGLNFWKSVDAGADIWKCDACTLMG